MAQKKRLAAAYKAVDLTKSYDLGAAIELVKSNATAKFDETIEISMNLGIDPRHADQMVRGLVGLPNGTGKTLRVGVFSTKKHTSNSSADSPSSRSMQCTKRVPG